MLSLRIIVEPSAFSHARLSILRGIRATCMSKDEAVEASQGCGSKLGSGRVSLQDELHMVLRTFAVAWIDTMLSEVWQFVQKTAIKSEMTDGESGEEGREDVEVWWVFQTSAPPRIVPPFHWRKLSANIFCSWSLTSIVKAEIVCLTGRYWRGYSSQDIRNVSSHCLAAYDPIRGLGRNGCNAALRHWSESFEAVRHGNITEDLSRYYSSSPMMCRIVL